MEWPAFIGPSFDTQSQIATGEKTINFYPEALARGKSPAALLSCPGFDSFATMSQAPGRGLLSENDRVLSVFGAALADVASDGGVTARGTLALDSNPATLSSSGDAGDEAFITSGDEGYILDLNTNVLTNSVSDVTFGGQVDGFFVALDVNSSTLKISDLLDGLTWDPTQTVTRTAASDPWVAMMVFRGEIGLFGERTSEIWYNSGASPFPFARRPGSFFEIGIAAPWSLARLGASVAWLGQSAQGVGRVYMLNGYTPVPISDYGIEWQIEQYQKAGGITNAIGWSYEQSGHTFYVLEFPSQGRTLVYDATTNQWHQRGYWSAAVGDFLAYRARWSAQAYGKTLVCDSNGAFIYSLEPTVYADVDGSELRRVRRGPHLSSENRKIVVDSFELEADRGVGTVSGQGADPKIMLRYSRDGGKTWGANRERSLGKMGEYRTSITWDRCGGGRDFVFEVAVTDPVPVRLINAYVRVRGA